MKENSPPPNDKRCTTCGSRLEWHEHGSNWGDDQSWERSEGIFRCPNGCETWTYRPTTQNWDKH